MGAGKSFIAIMSGVENLDRRYAESSSRRFLPKGRAWFTALVLIVTIATGMPLSLAHSTMHHVAMAAAATEISSHEQGDIKVESAWNAFERERAPMEGQLALEQDCVVCHLLHVVPLRAGSLSDRFPLNTIVYLSPFFRAMTKFIPPPLRRPPRATTII